MICVPFFRRVLLLLAKPRSLKKGHCCVALYIISSLAHSCNKLFNAPDMFNRIVHGITHKPTYHVFFYVHWLKHLPTTPVHTHTNSFPAIFNITILLSVDEQRKQNSVLPFNCLWLIRIYFLKNIIFAQVNVLYRQIHPWRFLIILTSNLKFLPPYFSIIRCLFLMGALRGVKNFLNYD